MKSVEIIKLFELIALAYDSFIISPEKVNFWQDMLSEIDFNNAEKMVREYIKTSRFPPTIADIIASPYCEKPRELTDDEIAMQQLIERMEADGRFNTAPGSGS